MIDPKIREVYERFKQFDGWLEHISNEEPTLVLVARDLWLAIKAHVERRPGTPIDEAVERMNSSPCSPSVCESLHLAAEAFGEDPDDESDQPDVTAEIRGTLAWIIRDLDARRDQGDTGLDPAPLSPEMKLAHQLLEDMRAGKIKCSRGT